MGKPMPTLRVVTVLALAGLSLGASAQDAGTDDSAAQDSAAQDSAAQDAPATPPAVDASQVVAADLAELTSFRQSVDRYNERMLQFDQDARDYLGSIESEERARLETEYGDQISALDDSLDELRSSAIEKFEAFLRKYPNNPDTAHAMFRLGDLYYEQSETRFLVDSQEYERLMADFDFDSAVDIPPEPQKDYSQSIALYRRIVSDYPDYRYRDGALYMLGFCLARSGSFGYDEEESRDVFQSLVDNYPGSRFAAAAHLRLGEYYFDYNQIEQAIVHYKEVIRLSGTEGDLYDEGLYKLAWSYYKISDYDQALTLFTQLLDWSAQNFERTGYEAATAPEAIEYSAISFSDLSNAQGGTPLEAAQAFYQQVGERDFEKDVYVRLASVLTDQALFADAIDVYRYLQDRWPDDPENPTHQWRIAQIDYLLEQEGDAQAAIQQLTETYGDDSTWWIANRNDPEAQTVARNYIEKSLAAVATGYHNDALETGDPAEFAKAAELYGQYLRKFPFAEDYYEIQWYRADTLMKTQQYAAAETEYLQLLKAKGHPYRDGALWNLMQVRKLRLEARYKTFDKRPEDAVEDHRVTLANGKERVIWKLSDDYLAFIDSATQLLEANITDPDFREAVDNNRVPLKYMIAQIYYHHGDYDKARPRLQDLIDHYPTWDEAAYAASMMINSYQDEGNLQKVQMLAATYAGKPLGGGVKKRDEFANIAEQAAFNLAEQLIEVDRVKAAEAFEQFMRDYPHSKYVTDAHYNAANSYQIAGRADDANRLFKQYIDNIESGVYPQDERSRALYFRIAGNYADVLDLQNAIRYYEALFQRFPDYQDSSSALYNAAFLRIGLGDHRGAATSFERYSKLTPTPADAEQVIFAAGSEWEKVSSDDAISFYRRYISQYPDANPDHVVEARYRIATLMEQSGSARQVDKAWADLADSYARLALGGQVGPRGRHYAGMAEVRNIEANFDSFVIAEFGKNEEKNVKLILETKPAELKALDDRVSALINDYADFDSSSAGLYFLGRAYLRYADLLFEAPPPKGLDEEAQDIYYEEIDKRRIPVEDKGRLRLEANVQKATQAKRWNEWITKTLDVLADRFPGDFAREKEELRAETDSSMAPRAGPMDIRPPPAEAAGEE